MYLFKNIILMFIIIAFLLTACSDNRIIYTEDTYKIGVITKSKNSEYWLSVESGMKEAADDYNIDLTIVCPNSETDMDIQIEYIYDMLNKNIDAIAISPLNSYDNLDYVEYAKEKNISIYAYDTKIAHNDVAYIGIDNKKVGYDLAKTMAEELGHRGNIAIISGTLSQECHRMRVEGFCEYMENEPDINISLVKSGYSNLRVPENELKKIFEDYPDLNGVMTTSAVTAMGISEATKGKDISIVSVDLQEDIINAIKNGLILAISTQSGYEIGYETIKYIYENKNNTNVPDKIIDTEIITKSNVDKY